MKTITHNILILSILFTLQTGNLFASIDGAPSKSANASNSFNAIFAPVVPKETTFDDDFAFDFLSLLAPATPKEATFDDNNDQIDLMNLNTLAPLTPREAGFDDETNKTNDLKKLAPVTPSEADFE